LQKGNSCGRKEGETDARLIEMMSPRMWHERNNSGLKGKGVKLKIKCNNTKDSVVTTVRRSVKKCGGGGVKGTIEMHG